LLDLILFFNFISFYIIQNIIFSLNLCSFCTKGKGRSCICVLWVSNWHSFCDFEFRF